MTAPFKTWLIDPYALVTMDALTGKDLPRIAEEFCKEVETDGSLPQIYDHLSYTHENIPGNKVELFQPVDVGVVPQHKVRGDSFYVDEEGLYNNRHDVWWTFKGAWQPFAGKGLAMGLTPSGNSAKPKVIDRDWITQNCLIGCQNFLYVPFTKKLYVLPILKPRVAAALTDMAQDPKHPVWRGESPL